MSSFLSQVWTKISRFGRAERTEIQEYPRAAGGALDFEIDAGDPLIAYFKEHPTVALLEDISLESKALGRLREMGNVLIAPLVCRGELVGLLNLGPRLSMQGYAPDDFLLLDSLITQAAPALRVAQLAEMQKAEALKNQRVEHEIHMARLIQHTLLPKELPTLPGWHIERFYQPAHDVGGDFYDFVALPDGRMALIIGDVTDKGMPAALLMATTRATLRQAAQRFVSPRAVLEAANEALYPDMPPSMFVTCLYALLDPGSGQLTFANAGHNLPYQFNSSKLQELRATGMPLGLLPKMSYEEQEASLLEGDSLLLYTDGLVEAHDRGRNMFGIPRLEELIRQHPNGDASLIQLLLSEMNRFSGEDWEQEDDVTLVTLHHNGQQG